MDKKDKISRLIYQSCHRGCKETDMILGRFAKKYIKEFDDKELLQYEKFINEDDWNIYAWVVGNSPFPKEHDNNVINLLKEFDFSSNPD